MARRTSSDPHDKAGLLLGTIRQVQLWWRLLWDDRVPQAVKLAPLLALLYVLFPLDLVVDPLLGIGQLDDLAVLVLGMELFVRLSPGEVVEQIWRDIHGTGRHSQRSSAVDEEGAQTVDATCRVVDDESRGTLHGGDLVRTGHE